MSRIVRQEFAITIAASQATFIAVETYGCAAVRVVRGDHKNYFYPDFVVCLSHIPGDTPIQRLVETKHDIKDAIRKARHTPPHYGKVMFLTQDGGRYHIINQDGSIGEEVDFADLAAMREEFKRTIGTVS